MRKALLIIFTLLAFAFLSIAGPKKMPMPLDAIISGDRDFSVSGKTAKLTLKKESCDLKSVGDNGLDGATPKSFQILFLCEGIKQILWDINKPAPDDFSFDDPKFALLWAGDNDGDGKIDLKMNMSPKYSCSKEVLYLSTKAQSDELVGILGTPKTVCGE